MVVDPSFCVLLDALRTGIPETADRHLSGSQQLLSFRGVAIEDRIVLDRAHLLQPAIDVQRVQFVTRDAVREQGRLEHALDVVAQCALSLELLCIPEILPGPWRRRTKARAIVSDDIREEVRAHAPFVAELAWHRVDVDNGFIDFFKQALAAELQGGQEISVGHVPAGIARFDQRLDLSRGRACGIERDTTARITLDELRRENVALHRQRVTAPIGNHEFLLLGVRGSRKSQRANTHAQRRQELEEVAAMDGLALGLAAKRPREVLHVIGILRKIGHDISSRFKRVSWKRQTDEGRRCVPPEQEAPAT